MVTSLEVGLILLAVFITIILSCAIVYVHWWRKKFRQEHAVDISSTDPHTTSSKELMYFLFWDNKDQLPVVGVPVRTAAKETPVMFTAQKEVPNLVPRHQPPPPLPPCMTQVSASDVLGKSSLEENGTLFTIEEEPRTDDSKKYPALEKPASSVYRYPSADLAFITPGSTPPFCTPMSSPPRTNEVDPQPPSSSSSVPSAKKTEDRAWSRKAVMVHDVPHVQIMVG